MRTNRRMLSALKRELLPFILQSNNANWTSQPTRTTDRFPEITAATCITRRYTREKLVKVNMRDKIEVDMVYDYGEELCGKQL